MVSLFRQKISNVERGRNPTTRHRNIDSYIYRHPVTIASLWSEDQLAVVVVLATRIVNLKTA